MARIVIDANVGVALTVNLAYSQKAEERMFLWREQRDEIIVPTLWKLEVVSALRKAVVAKVISQDQSLSALEDVFSLGVQEVESSLEIHRLALAWAARLEETVAYDAQYLALAEQLGAEFWTADKRLATKAHAKKASWVRWLGES